MSSDGQLLDVLLGAVRDLSLAREIEEVQRIVRTSARRLVDADGATFVLRDGDRCFYVDEDAIEPLWKGQRFPLEACISGWAMLNRRHTVIPDIYADPRVPHEAYRPTFVKSMLMVPIRGADPIGAIGMYWARQHTAVEREVVAARALADSTAVALESLLVREQLQRSNELVDTDALTGLPNRRAWDQLLADGLRDSTGSLCVAMLDLDGFKTFNDVRGHQDGDALLRRCGTAWRAVARDADVVARFGGDEFAVLLPNCELPQAIRVVERLRAAVPDGQTASAGVACWDGVESAEDLVGRADAALYDAKRAGRDLTASAA